MFFNHFLGNEISKSCCWEFSFNLLERKIFGQFMWNYWQPPFPTQVTSFYILYISSFCRLFVHFNIVAIRQWMSEVVSCNQSCTCYVRKTVEPLTSTHSKSRATVETKPAPIWYENAKDNFGRRSHIFMGKPLLFFLKLLRGFIMNVATKLAVPSTRCTRPHLARLIATIYLRKPLPDHIQWAGKA